MTTNEKLARQLHTWYLEAVEQIDPANFNPKANTDWENLNDEQRFLDRYIAEKTLRSLDQEHLALLAKIVGEELTATYFKFNDGVTLNHEQEQGYNYKRQEIINLLKSHNKWEEVEKII